MARAPTGGRYTTVMSEKCGSGSVVRMVVRMKVATRGALLLPVLAVLPADADYAPATLFRDLRTKVGVAGVYAIQLGDRFDARADPRVMSRSAVGNLVGSVNRSGYTTADQRLNSFVDTADQQAGGR